MKRKIARVKLFVFLLPVMFISGPIDAYIDEATLKFSRNQSQFEKSISNLNFEFSDAAVEKLMSDLNQTREVIKIKEQLEAAQNRLTSTEPGLDSIDFDVSSLDLINIEHYSEEERTNRDEFTFPSIRKWFSTRRRDWGLLGSEIMKTYDHFFAENKPSPESLKQLIEEAIENILSSGHFLWFDMGYPKSKDDIFSHAYSETMKSLNNGTIDMERYHIVLVNQVLPVFLSTASSVHEFYAINSLYHNIFSVRIFSKSDPTQFQDDYFPLLNEEHLGALFGIEARRQAMSRTLEELEDIKLKEADNLPDNTSVYYTSEDFIRPGEDLTMLGEDLKLHTPKVSKQRYGALKRVFRGCYEIDHNLKPAWKSEKLNFIPFFTDEKLPAFAQFYSFDHPDLYCRVIGAIFRQVYIENELEIYRAYISEGDFYKRGMKLREKLRAQSKKLEEAEVRLTELRVNLQEEHDKDNKYFWVRIVRGHTDPDKLKSIQAEIDEEIRNIRNIKSEKAPLEASLELYKEYNHFLYTEYLEYRMQEQERLSLIQLKEAEARLIKWRELANSEWYWWTFEHTMGSIQSMIAETEQDIVRIQKQKEFMLSDINDRETQQISVRLGVAEKHIQEFEDLLAYFQKEYKKAESQLASLSLESDYETIEAERVQAARIFFEGLRIKYQEYENRREIREQIMSLQSQLASLEEKKTQTSPLREKYLELKAKVISDLRSSRHPKLEDVFNGFLLRHYQPFGDDVDSFHAFRSSLNEVGKTGESSEIDSFKIAYEENIANTYHDSQPLLYNVDATSLAQPILENRMQCYSGSLLFYVLTELAGFTEVPRFAIFTNGHILPGILSNDGNELYGIESTAKGKGIVTIDPVPEVSGNIRVVEIYPFLLIEFLKQEISNFPELYAETQNSLRKYGFSIENLLPLDYNQTNGSKDDTTFVYNSSPDILNNTPFGFGSVNIPPVDLERQEITEGNLSTLETFNRSWHKRHPKTRIRIFLNREQEPREVTINTSTLEAFNKTWPEALNREEMNAGIFPLSYNLYGEVFCGGLQNLTSSFPFSFSPQSQQTRLETLKQFIIETGIDRTLNVNMENDPVFINDFRDLTCLGENIDDDDDSPSIYNKIFP